MPCRLARSLSPVRKAGSQATPQACETRIHILQDLQVTYVHYSWRNTDLEYSRYSVNNGRTFLKYLLKNNKYLLKLNIGRPHIGAHTCAVPWSGTYWNLYSRTSGLGHTALSVHAVGCMAIVSSWSPCLYLNLCNSFSTLPRNK